MDAQKWDPGMLFTVTRGSKKNMWTCLLLWMDWYSKYSCCIVRPGNLRGWFTRPWSCLKYLAIQERHRLHIPFHITSYDTIYVTWWTTVVWCPWNVCIHHYIMLVISINILWLHVCVMCYTNQAIHDHKEILRRLWCVVDTGKTNWTCLQPGGILHFRISTTMPVLD